MEILEYGAARIEDHLVEQKISSDRNIDIEVMDLIMSSSLEGMDDKLEIMLLTTNPHFEDLVKYIHSSYLTPESAAALGSESGGKRLAVALVSLSNTLSKPGLLRQTAYPIADPILDFIATQPALHQHFTASSFKIAQIERVCRSMTFAHIEPTPSFKDSIKARIMNHSLKMAKPATLVSLLESLAKLGENDKSVIAKVVKRSLSSIFSDALDIKKSLGLLTLMAQVDLKDNALMQAMESRLCKDDSSTLKEFSDSQLKLLGNVLLEKFVYSNSDDDRIVCSLKAELENRGTRVPKSWLPSNEIDQ